MNLKSIIFASGNPGKIAEIRALVEPKGISVVSAAQRGLQLSLAEDGETFAENAVAKAAAAAELGGEPALADDSGLEVDVLEGRPGVRSARYGGEDLDDEGRYQRLLTELFGAPGETRTARFQCVLAFVVPGSEPLTFHGTLEGSIAFRPAGTNGFGYDPIFVPAGYDRTLSELGDEIKNRISHRSRALAAFAKWLESSED
ncbi:MAG: RdgB/HAM1 family non-canonical purine NTP pyrophosphatase [Polyangia bacterium]